jgi:muconolactone delta-isomerase
MVIYATVVTMKFAFVGKYAHLCIFTVLDYGSLKMVLTIFNLFDIIHIENEGGNKNDKC